jgi:hypothetical protein
MTAEMSIIVKQYDDYNMSIEDIVAEHDGELEVESVKSVLAQYSKKYRDACLEEGNREDFSKDEALLAKEAIVRVMQSSDDDQLVLRAAKYIRDDKKGRLDVDKLRGLNINVFAFNEQLKKVKQARERTLAMNGEKSVIEV